MTKDLPPEFLTYREVIINHHKQNTLCDFAVEKIYEKSARNVVVLPGPTGVGKSTLLKVIEKRLNLPLYDSATASRYIPAVRSSVRPGLRELFDWKEVFGDALESMRIQTSDVDLLGPISRDRRRRGPQTEFLKDRRRMEALLNAFHERRSRTWLLDEGGKIARGTSKAIRRHRLEVLADFAERTDVTIIIAGTYDVLDMLSLSDQLGRRSQWEEYQRYKTRGQDIQEFCDIAIALADRSPIPFSFSPSSNIDWLYRRTLGCVGILHTLLYESAVLAYRRNSKQVSKRHLNEKALRSFALEEVAREIIRGEDKCRKRDQSNVLRLIESDINDQ